MLRPFVARVKLEHLAAVAGIAATVAVAVIIVRNVDFVRDAGAYGYAGILVVSILAGGTILVPIPALAVVFTLGGVLNPVWIGLVAGLGEAIGAMAIYVTGMGGRSLFQSRFPNVYPRVVGWVKDRGPIAVFLYSAVFNPFFYPLTLACGALRFGIWRFFLLCWAGKTIKGLLVAYAGFLGLRWLLGVGG